MDPSLIANPSMISPVLHLHRPLACLPGWRWLTAWIAMAMLLGALITPWGLAKSHGAAVFSASQHGESCVSDDGHGHSHDDDATAASVGHAHHAGDHSHDKAHALPTALPGLSLAAADWTEQAAHSGPWPSLDGLERPPRT